MTLGHVRVRARLALEEEERRPREGRGAKELRWCAEILSRKLSKPMVATTEKSEPKAKTQNDDAPFWYQRGAPRARQGLMVMWMRDEQ